MYNFKFTVQVSPCISNCLTLFSFITLLTFKIENILIKLNLYVSCELDQHNARNVLDLLVCHNYVLIVQRKRKQNQYIKITFFHSFWNEKCVEHLGLLLHTYK